ncbi:orotate phosphoribosyltransferase-like protein [Haloferax mediterranei ATCC 33500]|uniref:Transcriptional regulator GfcR n=1 Tax=Haloferax mediterranei (strain ATCC 33500 / DSM 1411 / JCM 8866 / NBRC 14739 / NCIMB 2177 / R-4) TaxID=523841 RepID=I3R3J5_HALMT|nr:transcriptional regulator GfcR [Haloferax mediterranei]AFK18805.1 orotate phosphoribosyltransferase-like protein/conserved Entner-Douderoff pathway protein [Haloferax mediterranei ATCC 33500]AHZ21827.1 orotate phosphoribosyltransferase-like protein [Haloferax mediterranei ATCC 33500]EMA03336.1 orotate phosphoribosyltransferase-like protein [Haloferax mediterranei ATCC 33500]MDX5988899.1 orotate phosphoribosyltransferase-like protein [Haloferax mediterranei ATCC 33500]QCQ75297.1 orotate phos
MKNVDDLIASAAELADRGLSKGEIADELNVSRETASWLVERSGAAAKPEPDTKPEGPDDIHVDWNAIGSGGKRLTYIGRALADLLMETGETADVTIGIEKAGVPLATAVSRELETTLGAYAPAKHQWDEGDIEDLGGGFSRNFAPVEDRDCFIVDDTVTSGTTLRETIESIRSEGGEPLACVVIVDKQGVEEIDGVPVYSLINVVRVGEQ